MIRRLLSRLTGSKGREETKEPPPLVLASGLVCDDLAPFGNSGTFFTGTDKRFGATCLFQVWRTKDVEMSRRYTMLGSRLARLQPAYVPALFDVGITEDGTDYMMLQHPPGAQVLDVTSYHGDRRRLVLELARALLDFHTRGLVHRDLRPEVIAVDASGRPWLFDVIYNGMLREDRQVRSIQRSRGGTPYDAPESREETYDGVRADIFSLGAIARDLLADGPTPAIVLKMVESIPRDRPSSMEQVVGGLQAAWPGL